MVDLKDLRDNPDRYRDAARLKRIDVDIDRLLALDSERRGLESQPIRGREHLHGTAEVAPG